MRTAKRARQAYNRCDLYEIGISLRGWLVPELLVRHLAHYVNNSGLTALEVGCGTGLVGQELQKTGWRGLLIGVDIAERRLKEAGAKSAYSARVQANAYRLPFSDRSFDIVMSSGMIGLTGPRSITEMQRLVRAGGYLACVICKIKNMNWCVGRFQKCRTFLNKLPNSELLLKKDLGTGYSSDYNDEHYILYILRCS